MSAAKKHRSVAKEQRRARRRRHRKIAAATSTLLLAAAAVAGEPVSFADGSMRAAASVGGGLFGMTNPGDVGASGDVGEDGKIGDEVLASAGDIDRLLGLGAQGPLPDGQLALPGIMAEAYRNAAAMLAAEQPNCNLHWSLLASIGRIESNHARGGQVDANGNTVPNILGPVLNGGGFAAIRDTDGGSLDGESRWDRAVGAMQFIPSTWSGYASDGNADGVSNPHNVWDATLAAGKYLCSGGMDLSDPTDVATAVFRYNHSDSYVATVLLWAEAYRNGTPILPSDPVETGPGNQALGPPPVVPGAGGGAKPPAGSQKPAPNAPPPGGGGSNNPPPGGGSSGPGPTGGGSDSPPPGGGSEDPDPTDPTTTTTTTPPCEPSEEPTETTTPDPTTTTPDPTDPPCEPSEEPTDPTTTPEPTGSTTGAAGSATEAAISS